MAAEETGSNDASGVIWAISKFFLIKMLEGGMQGVKGCGGVSTNEGQDAQDASLI